MLKNISFIMRLRNSYRANSVIFSLRSLPFAKKILPPTLYANRGVKLFANIIAAIIEFFSAFFGKIIYFLVVIFMLDYMYSDFGVNIEFSHLFVFLTFGGAIANNRFDNATRDSYYAIFNLKMPARDYAVSEMSYFLLKTLLGFMLFSLLGGLFIELNITEMILIPIFVTTLKIAFMPLLMFFSHSYTKVMGRSVVQTAIGLALVVIGLFTGYLGMQFTVDLLVVFTVLSFAASVVALNHILKFKGFKEFYRKLFVTDIMLITSATQKGKQQILSDSYGKQITDVTGIVSNKKGFAYLNDLFVKRHRKILSRSAFIFTAVIAVIAVGVGVFCIIDGGFANQMNNLILNDLPFLLFIMYFINRGNSVTLAMFANCDGAMLHYGFYRKPTSLLKNFGQRLVSLIKINLIPGAVIAVSLPVLLYITGGSDRPTDYLLVFVTIIAISVFFSVHSMVLYYLLQPYNERMELKSPIFTIANTITYIVCYTAIGEQMSLLFFCVAAIGFCLIYVVVALMLAYKLAPKTFRLRR